MILFLDFTPIEFMGGTEKWMNDIAKKINTYENTQIISVNNQISNIYGMFIAKRKYDKRVKRSEIHNHTSLGFQAFIPFTKRWKVTRESFSNARLIYMKCDVLEFLILVYFSGIRGLKKTIIGLHSPFIYHSPLRFFDYLHNAVYRSGFSKYILKNMRKVHVINFRDKLFLESKFLLKNVKYIPNGVKITSEPKYPKSDNKLHVLFVGELSERKGIDILIDVIKHSPEYIQFDITSDGPLKEQIKDLANSRNNCNYHGYVNNTEKQKLTEHADVLILPSRGEGFPLVILDAMSQGLCIVNSHCIRLGLPNYVEYTSKNNSFNEYLDILEKIYQMKQALGLQSIKKNIFNYCNNNLSEKYIFPRLAKEIFSLKKISPI